MSLAQPGDCDGFKTADSRQRWTWCLGKPNLRDVWTKSCRWTLSKSCWIHVWALWWVQRPWYWYCQCWLNFTHSDDILINARPHCFNGRCIFYAWLAGDCSNQQSSGMTHCCAQHRTCYNSEIWRNLPWKHSAPVHSAYKCWWRRWALWLCPAQTATTERGRAFHRKCHD